MKDVKQYQLKLLSVNINNSFKFVQICALPKYQRCSTIVYQIMQEYILRLLIIQTQYNMKKLLSRFDIFASLPTLRAEGQSQVVNLCGSIFSMLVFGSFIYLFISSMVSTINYQTIESKETFSIRPVEESISNITISVGIFNTSILNLRHIIELHAFLSDRHFNKIQLDVFPCTRDMWSSFDDTKYQTLNIKNNLCIQREGVQIYGQFGTPEAKFIVLNLTVCSNLTSPVPCAPPALINYFFANRLMWNRFLPCSLIIENVDISPTNKDPLSYNPYEKTQFLLFNLEQSMFVQTFLGTFQINTDTSFFPFQQQSQIKGHFVSQCVMTTIVNYLDLPVLMQAYIFPSPVHKVINRSYGKLDNILSYVGGLYGIVISFLAFFLMSFNQYKYELRVGGGAFAYKDAHLIRQQDFTFPKYIKYVFYDWIKTLFCYELKWKDCQAIDEARQEAIEQIDVRHMLKRISHLQKVISAFLNPTGEIFMYMAESNTLQEVRKKRSIVQYCHRFAIDQKSPTIENFEILETVVTYSMNSLFTVQSSVVYPGIKQQDADQTFQMNAIDQERQQMPESLSLMHEYVRKYIKQYTITEQTFSMSQNELKAEQQLLNAFYKIDEETRLKLIKKIPLGILYRLSKYERPTEKSKIQVSEVGKQDEPPQPQMQFIQFKDQPAVFESPNQKKRRVRKAARILSREKPDQINLAF